MPKIVIIGGGTGTFTALTGLKRYTTLLTAIVTMADSGGSSGLLRDELGVLPPGDVRQCLVALSGGEKIWRDLFNYRFVNGGLSGHNFGNIFLSALEKITGSMDTAIKAAAEILHSQGKVIPVTFDQTNLCVELENGEIIKGETHVDEPKHDGRLVIKRAFLKPQAFINPEAVLAINEADLILFGPGDLYTSIIPNLLVSGFAEAVQKNTAKTIFVMNLMTKFGQTNKLTASGHLNSIEKYLKKKIDTVLLNKMKPSKETLSWYLSQKEKIVDDDMKNDKRIKRLDLIRDVIVEKNSGDRLKRSLIRHDPEKLARAVMEML